MFYNLGFLRYGIFNNDASPTSVNYAIEMAHARFQQVAGTLGTVNLLLAYLRCGVPMHYEKLLLLTNTAALRGELLLGLVCPSVILLTALLLPFANILPKMTQIGVIAVLLCFTIANYTQVLHQYVAAGVVLFLLREAAKNIFLRRILLAAAMGAFFMASKLK